MNPPPVSHYLKLYRRRVSMAERGITKPMPGILNQMRTLVAGLEKVDPTKEVKLVQLPQVMLFKVSGEVVGSIDIEQRFRLR